MNTQFGICEEGCVGFSRRHIGPSPRDAEEMLRFLSVDSLDALIEETVPQSIRQQEPLDWPALSETEVLSHLANVASRNRVFTSLIGQGYYGAILPPVIQRNILENPAWYTAYTPYQPEISQGRLEALFNFQTMICDLTGFDIANASLLDEATAAAEAMAMARRVAKVEPTAFFVDAACHPQTIAVLATRAEPLNWTLIVGDPLAELDPSLVFGALFQYPGTDGRIRDFGPAIVRLKKAGAISVMAADPLALTLLVPPAELGADLAVGSTQRFGVPMGYGGPHAAYIAARDAYKRALPGRLVGASVDSRGAKAYRLALQTREQHIRREKATSNICTAQVLLAVIASMYAVYHGPDGLAAIARRIHKMTATLGEGLGRLGFAVGPDRFFDTITVAVGSRVDEIRKRAEANNLNFRFIDDDKANAARVGISLDETTTPEVIAKVWHVFGGDLAFDRLNRESTHKLSEKQIRRSPFLTHPVFHQHRSETEMLRYMRRLADRDLALDRAMIPLGSCTMKLNATVEMIPVTMSQFSALHPFAPTDQAEGYSNMLGDLEAKLCAITGYDAISFQPNSGAQGEYAGLLVIRAYHRSRGEKFRNVCLIPSSAHGTNPASAHLAGMEVVVVNCDQSGNVEIVDLHMKAGQHARELAAIMVTYPSTHGVFEEGIRDICEIVHAHGGQVYLDGANLNAQVGVARPADYGADVSHLNLHKTFCIPHGGGGPGMGPIGVRAHLIPFLPGDPQRAAAGRAGPVSAAPFGSASILSVSFAYMLLMGGNGLTLATKTAILNANYVATRLEGYYPILYKGPRGRVAHECILDPRALKDLCGVTVQDIAKRLIDYGFHAPTVSFPVPGTLMVEPTESESKAELDRFCNAMIAIRKEIDDIEKGRWPVAQSPLRNAPHTVHDLATDEWTRPYSRAEGCFPHGSTHRDKYWSPVNRVDDAHGDRNLVCTYPPSDYQTAAQ